MSVAREFMRNAVFKGLRAVMFRARFGVVDLPNGISQCLFQDELTLSQRFRGLAVTLPLSSLKVAFGMHPTDPGLNLYGEPRAEAGVPHSKAKMRTPFPGG